MLPFGALCAVASAAFLKISRVSTASRRTRALWALCARSPCLPSTPHGEFDPILQIPAQKPAPSPFQDTALDSLGPAVPVSPRSACRGSPTRLIPYIYLLTKNI